MHPDPLSPGVHHSCVSIQPCSYAVSTLRFSKKKKVNEKVFYCYIDSKVCYKKYF